MCAEICRNMKYIVNAVNVCQHSGHTRFFDKGHNSFCFLPKITAGPCDTQVQAVDGSGLGSPDAQTDIDWMDFRLCEGVGVGFDPAYLCNYIFSFGQRGLINTAGIINPNLTLFSNLVLMQVPL